MVLSRLLLATLAPLVATDSTCVDETSLMQGLKPTKDLQRRDGRSIANLMETSKNMLKNGETEDVSRFAQATFDEINGPVILAITEAIEVDQALLDARFAEFGRILDDLAVHMSQVNTLVAHETDLSTRHKACRGSDVGSESHICGGKINCDYELYRLWLEFVDEESTMRQYELDFDRHFCAPDANGTVAIFRETAEMRMDPIIEFWPGTTRDVAYDAKVVECEERFANLDDKTAICNALQAELEDAACIHANKVHDVRAWFAQQWATARIEYADAIEYVTQMRRDRINEVKSLSIVQCLIQRTRDRNGRPCDEATDEATVEVAHCEELRQECGIPSAAPHNELMQECPEGHAGCGAGWLLGYHTNDIRCTDIVWLNHHTPAPPGCPGLPDVPHAPCTAGFIQQEYASLPAVPQPDFHTENSHCNQRPSCSECELPAAVSIDWDDICTGEPPATVTVTTTAVPEENCPDPYGNFRVCSAWGDPHFSHVFYRDAAAAQATHEHGRRGNAFGTMMQHHQVGVYDLARSNDGTFAAQAFFCHADMSRATTSVNGMVVTMNGQRTSFIRSARTGPLNGDAGQPNGHVNPAVGGAGDNIYGSLSGASEATDLSVNGEALDWNTLGDGVGGGPGPSSLGFTGGSHVSDAHHQGRTFGNTWMQQLSPSDRADRTLAPVCMGDKARTKTVSWSLPFFYRVYEPIFAIYMEESSIAESGLCGSEAALQEGPMQTSDERWMFETSEIEQICNVCGMTADENFGCVVPGDYTPPENVRQICEFNNVDFNTAQTACDAVAGAAAWLEACIQEYCAEAGLDAADLLQFIQQMEGDQEAISDQEEGGGAFQVLIGRSESNDRCVQVQEANLICDVGAGHPGVRINLDYASAGDTFHITATGNQVCAQRTDSTGGWGMQLEIQCQIPAPADTVYVYVDSSTTNTKCIDTPQEVHCNAFAGNLGSRVNDHPAGDEFDITTTPSRVLTPQADARPSQVCARRLDSDGGWGMHLHLLCHAGPAPLAPNAPGSELQVFIDRSASDNTRCVTSTVPVTCAADAGNLGSRINDHPAADRFDITVNGDQVCAQRLDSNGGWGMRLRLSCIVAGLDSAQVAVDDWGSVDASDADWHAEAEDMASLPPLSGNHWD